MKPYLCVKGILDFVFALILVVVLLPVMALCALLLAIEDPSEPFLYKTERAGKGNKVFTVFKFRSMRVETERDGQKLSDSERMLKVGGILRKLSLDELPQLFNVIRGEMSFIGPRPLPVRYLPYYTDEEIHRHDIRPGLSGWAQVNGRNFLSWERKLKYDLEYVSNISFPFDLWILLVTIRKVFSLSDVGIRGVDIADESLHEIRKPNKNWSQTGGGWAK